MLRTRHAVEGIFFASERGSGGEGGSPLGASAEAKVFVIREKRERHFPALCKEAVSCTNFYLQPGAEGFQRAIGKPFGRLRRGEILWDTGKERKAFSCPLQVSCFLHKFLLAARGRRFPKGERKALWSPPQRRNPLGYGESKKGSFPCLPQGMYFLWEVSSACGRTRYFPRAGKYPKGATGYVFAKGEYVGRKATWLSLSESQPWAAKGCMRRGRPRSPRC